MSTPVLSPVSMTSFYDPYTGAVLQASLYFYRAQTLDQISVWTDPLTSTNHQQPVLTSGSGRVPPIWIKDEGYYRIRSFDQYGTLLEDIDGLPGAIPDVEDGGGSGGTPGALPPANSDLDLNLDWGLLQPGDIFASFSAGATKRLGAVRCNGGTIGRGAGGDPAPSEHAGIECYNLYVWLWGQDALTPNNLLYMPAGKGSTALGDWKAGRLLTLPDLRGRTIVGTDPMGNGASTGRMTGARFEKAGAVITTGVGSDASVPGAGGGLAKLTLTINEMPVHTHAVYDPTHGHTGTTLGQNANHRHLIDGFTDTDGTHEHSYARYSQSGPNNHAGGTSFPRQNDTYQTTGGGAHRHHMSFWSGYIDQNHAHDFATTSNATGILIYHAGGKGTAPTPPASFVTQPFNLAQPFLTLTFYMSLGPPRPIPVIPA
jgi:microcystin-dependent protein